MDRFLMRIALGYPDEEEENEVPLRYERRDPLEALEPVVEAESYSTCSGTYETVRVEESVREYIVNDGRARARTTRWS